MGECYTESTSKDATIITLATAYKRQKYENSKIKANAKGVTTPVPKNEPQGQSLSKGTPKWRTTKVGATNKDPETGAKFIWCPYHGNKAKGGVQPGMYLPINNNHTQWDAYKKTKADA